MLEQSSVFAYKSIFQIAPAISNDPDFLENLYTLIYRDCAAQSTIAPDFHRFCNGTHAKSEDEAFMLRTASYRPHGSETVPFQWAMLLRSRDSLVKRRTWNLHISLDAQKDSAVTFGLALQYSDHLAGSLSPLTSPVVQPPRLLQRLLRHPALFCFSGESRIPASPIHLMTEDIPDFLNQIFDQTRTSPITLITCPDLINPSVLHARSLGNLIVCWLDDYPSYERLCELLPAEIQFPWDAVKIFMPIASKQPYHPVISIENITGMGGEAVINSICHAYCMYPTGAERRAFVTVGDLYEQYKERTSEQVRVENDQLHEEHELLSQTIQSLTESNAQLSTDLEACKTQIAQMHDASWEELLDEALQENEKLKEGLTQIISSLFDDLNSPLLSDGLDSCKELHELAVAIRTFRNLLMNRPR